MPKRVHTDDGDLKVLRATLLAKLSGLMSRTEDELTGAIAASPTATLIDLGLTSAMGISLKGWAFKDLQAELTTFEMLKQPFDDVVASIDRGQRQNIGCVIPNVPAPADLQSRAAELAEPVSQAAA